MNRQWLTILPDYLLQCGSRELSALRVPPREIDKNGFDGLERPLSVRMLRRYPVRGENLPSGLPFLSRRKTQLTRPGEWRSSRSGFPSRRRWFGARRRSRLSHSRSRLGRGRPGFNSRRALRRRGSDGFTFSRWRRGGFGVRAVIGAAEALKLALFEIIIVEALAFAALAALVTGLLGMCGHPGQDDESQKYGCCSRYSNSVSDKASAIAG